MAVKPIPDGYHTVTPYLTVPDLPRMLEFAKAAFDAHVYEALADESGMIRHAEMQIGSSRVMVGQARADYPATQSKLYLYVENTDDVYARAMAAGAKSILAPMDQFYGDRNAAVDDPLGNQWWIATHVEDVTPEEMARRAKEQMT
jgi:PhnB protein